MQLVFEIIQQMFDLLIIIYIPLIVYTLYRILFDTNSATKALAYILLVITVPVLGIIIYFSFGINYRKHKIYDKQLKIDKKFVEQISELYENQINKFDEKYKTKLGDFYSLAKFLLVDASELISANTYELLINGENKFPQVTQEISSAKHHIHMEYYIWENDHIGNEIKNLLIKKHKEGVQVRVMYDAYGSRGIKNNIVRELSDAGVNIHPVLKIKLVAFANRINHRDHRKIIIIDGNIGFIGGINISDRYDNRSNNDGYWRDTHLKIIGPAVANLQRHFVTKWNYCSPEFLVVNKLFFPNLDTLIPSNNDEIAQIMAGGPDYKRSYILLSFFKIFAEAKEKLYITTPYFIPNETIIIALKQAALGGVDVRLIIPEESDSIVITAASKYYLRSLLSAGVKVYLYEKGFVHAKTIVADSFLSVIGSANMDIRSFDLNYEINAIIYGKNFGKKMENLFYDDLEHCSEIVYSDWEKLSKWKQLGYSIARLLSYFL
jgi:cardiolipin synthase